MTIYIKLALVAIIFLAGLATGIKFESGEVAKLKAQYAAAQLTDEREARNTESKRSRNVQEAQNAAAISAQSARAAAAAAEIQASDSDPSSSNVALRTASTTADASVAPTTDAPAASDTKTSTGGGIMSFIKANPVPAVIGGGLLAFGIYQMVKPKKKATGLSGYKSKKKSTTTKSTSRATKSKTTHHNATHTHKSMPPKVMKLL